MAVTFLTANDITEQTLPTRAPAGLTPVEVAVIGAQIVKRESTKKTISGTADITGQWRNAARGAHYGTTRIDGFEFCGIYLPEFSGSWNEGTVNWQGKWSVTNGKQVLSGSWVNNLNGTITISVALSGEGVSASGTLISTTEYEVEWNSLSGALTGSVEAYNTVTMSDCNPGVGKYSLSLEQLELASYLTPGTADQLEGCDVKELHAILSDPGSWRCRNSLDNFLASDQTDALVDVIDKVGLDNMNIPERDLDYALNYAQGLDPSLFKQKTPVLRSKPKSVSDTYPDKLKADMAAIINAPVPPANFTRKPQTKAGKC